MTRFSERMGVRPFKSLVQTTSIDDDLRTSLWNLLELFYWAQRGTWNDRRAEVHELCVCLWFGFFKKPIDEIPDGWMDAKQEIRDFFFDAPWYDVYDFVEFVAANGSASKREAFMEECNATLEREVAAYRFVGGILSPVISEVEIAELEEALDTPLTPVRTHLRRALELLADRQEPDYRNSIKESISAVEAVSRLLTGNPKATLGMALKQITALHPALSAAFSALYGYTSDEGGVRHSLIRDSASSYREAKFMLVACSAFVNYVAEDLPPQASG